MEQIANFVAETVAKTMLTDNHICPYCGRVVEKKRYQVLGKIITVQPICECESRADDEYKRKLAARERKSKFQEKYSTLTASNRYRGYAFDNFEVDGLNQQAFDYAQWFTENFPLTGNLYIYGRPGNGKSHLAAAVANALNTDENIVIFTTFTEILERIKATFGNGSGENEAGIIRALTECDLLVLDDLGVEKPSDFTCDVLFRIIDKRMRDEKPIVFTSNYGKKELAKRYGAVIGGMEAERIISRMIDGANVAENLAGNHRKEKGRVFENGQSGRAVL